MVQRRSSGLSVRFGPDLASLADDLASRLKGPELGVLEPEVVVVPTPGISAWLEARLSRALGASGTDDGICANVEVLLVGDLLRRVAGRRRGDDDPWAIGPMTIALVAALLEPDALDEVSHLRPRDAVAGLFSFARTTADLFDRLFRWRPDVADEWLDGSGADPRAGLLLRLAARTDVPAPHRALAAAIARLADGDDAGLDLPARIQLFGGDSLPGGPQFPQVLDALGAVRDVAVHLVVPSVGWFDGIVAATPRWGPRPPARPRDAAPGAMHPLLRTWGTVSADAAAQLAQLEARPTTQVAPLPERLVAATGADSLLGALQAAISRDAAARRPRDDSVSLHGCVGDVRHVEVARDAILHALARDPALEPSDVIVLCADLPRFAPFVDAVLGDPQGAPALPYVLRDRAVAKAVPLVASMEAALRLLGGRIPRSEVLDLFRDPMVQRRFDLEGEDVDRIAEWSVATDVRWGLDAAHRASVGLPDTYESGTWRRALDRLLAGVALPNGAESRVLGLRAVSPGHTLERVGSLCDALAALADLDERSHEPRSVAGWCDFVRDVLAALFAPGFDDVQAVEQLHGVLASLEDDAAGVAALLPFSEFRALIDDRASSVRDLVVSGPGGVTVTSLAPLRNIPFDVVVLLGLDERSVERTISTELAFGEARIGDRDARADVRAALLGAVLSARSRLVVTYEVADVVSNEPVAPASVLAELREALAAVCSDDVRALEHRHPRHAHGDDDLRTDASSGVGAFTFDHGAYARALELRSPARATVSSRLPAVAPAARGRFDRAELVAFLTAPQRAFLAATHGVRLPTSRGRPGDEIPTGFDDLERWQVTRSLVDDGLRAEIDVAADAEWEPFLATWVARPDAAVSALPGQLSGRALAGSDGIEARSRDLLTQVARARGAGPAERLAVEVPLGAGDTLVADVEVCAGRRIVQWTASSHDRHVRVAAMVDLLALTAAHPEVDWRAMRIWREGKRATCRPLSVPGDTAGERRTRAIQALDTLADLRHRGLHEPLPLLFRVTMQMLGAFKGDGDPSARDLLADGLRGWTQFNVPGDQDDPAVKFCFDASYDELCALEVLPGDPVVRLDTGGSRLLTYSLALLEGLCAIDALEPARSGA
jgi:exodeoxyribonuclease V gamma subunit